MVIAVTFTLLTTSQTISVIITIILKCILIDKGVKLAIWLFSQNIFPVWYAGNNSVEAKANTLDATVITFLVRMLIFYTPTPKWPVQCSYSVCIFLILSTFRCTFIVDHFATQMVGWGGKIWCFTSRVYFTILSIIKGIY